MKAVYVMLLVAICMTGCSFRDGASTTAAGLSSGLFACFGAHDTYGDTKDYWDKKFGVQPELPGPDSPVMKDVSDQIR